MKKLKIFPAPHVEIRVSASDEMVQDLEECKRLSEGIGDGKDCKTCSWHDVTIGNIRLCNDLLKDK